MLRKIFGLLIFPILGASVHTYAQEEYDQQIFQYINQEKWFDAKSLYDTRHDDLSEVIRLISGAFLGAYFNRPAEGVSAIEELLAKYGGQLGGQAVMYRMLAAKNFASVRAYAKMDSVFTYMLAYDSPYLDDQTRKGIASGLKQCRKIARLPRTEVIDRSREGSPRHGRHEAGGGSILPGRGLLRQKREDPAGYRGRIHFDRPEPGRRTGCPYISGFAVDGPGIIHETGNSQLPANRIHHPQKRDLLCLPRRSGGTESGSDRRFGHHTDPGDAGDFDAEETIGPDRGCRARNHHVRHREATANRDCQLHAERQHPLPVAGTERDSGDDALGHGDERQTPLIGQVLCGTRIVAPETGFCPQGGRK